MDPVHGSKDKVGGRKATIQKDSQLFLQELVGGAHDDVSLERSARLSSITKEESLIVRFAGADMQRSFNHQIGNCGVDVIAPAEAHHTVAAAGAMCAHQRLLCSEATLERPGGPREGFALTSL